MTENILCHFLYRGKPDVERAQKVFLMQNALPVTFIAHEVSFDLLIVKIMRSYPESVRTVF